jgi:transcriptional regulator with XRE-family HTH domain
MSAPEPSLRSVGAFIRTQRELMSLSMRQLAEMAKVSNPYLSQIERGLFTPSAQVLKGIAGALDLSTETLYQQAGLLDAADEPSAQSVEEAIRMDRRLTQEGKQALTQVYRGLVRAGEPGPDRPAARRRSAPRQPATATGKPTSKRPSR